MQQVIKSSFASRYAITFGENSIPDIKNLELLKTAEHGFSTNDLKKIQQKMEQKYSMSCKLYNLSEILPAEIQDENSASVLYMPGLANHLIENENGADKLYQEQESIKYDRMFYNYQTQKTQEKTARYSLVFRENSVKHSEDYKQYTINDFKASKYLNQIRHKIASNFQASEYLNEQLLDRLEGQGNYYFNNSSNINFHGDKGRKIVIGLSLGRPAQLRYCWRPPFCQHNDTYTPIDIPLSHGDIYIMSQKASGQDYLQQNLNRVVHSAYFPQIQQHQA